LAIHAEREDRLRIATPVNVASVRGSLRLSATTPQDKYLVRNWQREDAIMQTVVRTYSGHGARELFDVLEKHSADVEKLMRLVKGFVAYTLARSSDGGFSVTVCEDKAGIDQSIQKAKDWIGKNAESTGVGEAKISEGTVILHLK
jgi:hypothetical protein